MLKRTIDDAQFNESPRGGTNMHTRCHHCCIVFKYTQVSYLQLIFSMFLERLVKMCQIRPQFLLEAKIQLYKLYDKSFLSLILKNGWIADEVAKTFIFRITI